MHLFFKAKYFFTVPAQQLAPPAADTSLHRVGDSINTKPPPHKASRSRDHKVGLQAAHNAPVVSVTTPTYLRQPGSHSRDLAKSQYAPNIHI